MGLRIKTQKNLPIGVDLGSCRVKMAQLRTSRDGVEMVAMGSGELPLNGEERPGRQLGLLAKKIRDILKTTEFNGREAVVSLPAAAIFLQPVRISVVRPSQVDDAVAAELQGKLPYPVADAVIRHIPAGSVYADGKEMQERIVVAISRRDLSAFLSMARSAGLDVVGINIEACAVVECFARLFRRRDEESSTTLFADIGATSIQVVLTRGQKMIFARNLSVGGHTLDKVVAEALQIPIEQAHRVGMEMMDGRTDEVAEDELFRLLSAKIGEIAGQMTHCLQYCESSFSSQAIDRMIFVGGQANNKRFCQCIAERLNLPAQVGNPMAGVKMASNASRAPGVDARQPQPSWAVAIGLSLGATHAA